MRVFRARSTGRLRRPIRSSLSIVRSTAGLERLESRHLLAAVPFGEQELIDDLDAESPASIYMADIDSDGDSDAVISSFGDGRIAWFENDGQGGFSRHPIGVVEVNDERRVREVIAADLDGDGDQDVAVAAHGLDRVLWFENLDGRGNFDSSQIVTTETDGAVTLAASDIDGDGDLDLVSGSWFDSKIAWYENDGDGNFGLQRIISTATQQPRHLRVGDMDGDNRPDVVVASRLDDTVSWFKNLGSGNFGDQQKLSSTADGPQSVALSDVDADGDLDVFITSFLDAKVAWFENLGNGNFGAQLDISTTADRGRFVITTDMDGDGDQDVVSSSYYFEDGKVAWFENTDGKGTFGSEKVVTTELQGPDSLAATDVDGDGNIDLLVAVGHR